jgi:hypothetical protein
MIRFLRLSQDLLEKWLVIQRHPHTHGRYRLRVWRENREELAAIRGEVIQYLEEALEDARMRIRRGFEEDLSPFRAPPLDPAAYYPALLHRVTLQGYFGETLAVISVEHWGAHGYMDWAVPAFLFRLHDQEFQHLESINERLEAGENYDPDRTAERRPGRTGDDGIAFRINGDNTITDVLTLEAKCLTGHNSSKIEEAHRKLNAGGLRPTGVRELINILNEYDTPEAQAWQEALLKLWRGGYQTAVRYDGVCYTCGQRPIRRIAWLPTDAPHPVYTVTRNLEGMEFQLEDLATLIDKLYRGA